MEKAELTIMKHKEQYLIEKLERIAATIQRQTDSAIKHRKKCSDPRALAAISGKIGGYIQCRTHVLDFIEDEQLRLAKAKEKL